LVRSGFMTTGCIQLGEIHFICITYTESKLTIPYCVSFKPPRLPIRFALGIHPSCLRQASISLRVASGRRGIFWG
jgi:hypothetical protein